MASRRSLSAVAYIGPASSKGARQAITRWAAKRGVRIASWVDDAAESASSSLRERPALLGALAALRTSSARYLVVERPAVLGDPLLVAAIDRLVQRAGGELAVVESFTRDAWHERLVTAFADYEYGVLSARMRATWTRSRKRGERLGTVPWGFRRKEGGTLEPDEVEQNVIGVVRHMRSQGFTLNDIVDFLKETGVRGRSGKPLGTTRVFEIIHGGRKKSAPRGPARSPARAM
jgi:DNA invertase Pin-like site-specific DNA recombinase